MQRETGCGSSTGGVAEGWVYCRKALAQSLSHATGPLDCYSIVATCLWSGTRAEATLEVE